VQGMFVGAVEAMSADPTTLGDGEAEILRGSVCEVTSGLSVPYSLLEAR
jgi:hypothetical protein